ncbi:MAG: phosphate ABC transporter substrate-binding protein [Gammaproteobacteria bacterium]|nr:phosphate ABC transporter substrate-binding protein [Gammaproteobacteria bacterium]
MAVASVSIADISVIVHPSSNVSSLSNKDLKRLYLGKTSTLPSGDSVTLLDQKFGFGVRKQFYKLCCKVTALKAQSRWAGILFSGGSQPPFEAGGGNDVLSLVASNKRAMGYVDSTLVNDTVKVIKVLK